jgi:hypothetical protein
VEPKKSILVVGIVPELIDFSHPDFAHSNLSAEKIWAGLRADGERLRELGYDAEFFGVDFGDTAEPLLAGKLQGRAYDCVVIGAGVRLPPSNFLLFEKLVNVVIRNAPQARLCFNTKPSDTAEAVLRWV